MNDHKAIVIPADKKEEFLSRLGHSYDKLMERWQKAIEQFRQAEKHT